MNDINLARMQSKVPRVTVFFWVIKILATTVGETAADYLSVNLGLGLTGTTYVTGALLLVALAAQIRSRRYVPTIYWIAVVLLSVFGTLITDNLVDNFRVPLETTTAVFSVALAITFAAWYTTERTLDISTIHTTRRELFYWAAILFTFALGTAAGDLLAEGLALGYAVATLLFAAAIGIIAVAHFRFGLNAVFSFWAVYVLTRPLGASLGDLLSQPGSKGGVGLGSSVTSLLFLVTIAVLIAYLTRNPQKDVIPLDRTARGS